MITTATLKPHVDNRLRAGASAFGLAALMSVPSLSSVIKMCSCCLIRCSPSPAGSVDIWRHARVA
jgi:hypothetical protein